MDIKDRNEDEGISKNIKIWILLKDKISDPYVRILMFNQSGRLIKKKKTTVKVNTKDPVFNETLNFEVLLHFFSYHTVRSSLNCDFSYEIVIYTMTFLPLCLHNINPITHGEGGWKPPNIF